MNRKEFFRNNIPNDTSVFHKPFWLDFVCGENWDICLEFDSENEIVAYMPFYFEKKNGLYKIKMPKLTPFLGPVVLSEKKGIYQKNSSDNDLVNSLFAQMPEWIDYNVNWHFGSHNLLLPIAQKPNFFLKPKYTYFVNSSISAESFYSEIKLKQRNSIKSAKKSFKLTESFEPAKLYSLVERTYSRQNSKASFSKPFFLELCNSIRKNNAGFILFCLDKEDVLIAGGLFVTDSKNTYYLVGGVDLDKPSQGTMAFLIWSAIEKSLAENRNFDFEGSILPGVENFFRSFGSERRLFFTVIGANKTARVFFEDGLRSIKSSLKLLITKWNQ